MGWMGWVASFIQSTKTYHYPCEKRPNLVFYVSFFFTTLCTTWEKRMKKGKEEDRLVVEEKQRMMWEDESLFLRGGMRVDLRWMPCYDPL